MVGHGNAGLASNFIDLAHAKVCSSGGVIALVLPASFLQGKAWAAARRLLDENYEDVIVVSIASTGETNLAFSADTGMAEVLVVATKSSTRLSGTPTLFVNINRRPQSVLEAVAISRGIKCIPSDHNFASVTIGGKEKVGCSIRSTLSDTGCAGLRDVGIAQAASGLTRGELRLPHSDSPILLPITSLGELGNRGLYHMDISGTECNSSGSPRGPFDIVNLEPGDFPTWPALWSHNAKRESKIIVMPNRAGEVRTGCESRATEAWHRTASRLHFNRDFRVNSQPLAACLTPDLSIGGTAWPNFLCDDIHWEDLLVLWANTTLGLISFWWIGTRQQTGRARISISKLPDLSVLDPRRLSQAQFELAGEVFEQFQDLSLLPANEAWRDGARQALDRAILVDVLEHSEEVLEPLALLRLQWCAEPSVHGGKSTAPDQLTT